MVKEINRRLISLRFSYRFLSKHAVKLFRDYGVREFIFESDAVEWPFLHLNVNQKLKKLSEIYGNLYNDLIVFSTDKPVDDKDNLPSEETETIKRANSLLHESIENILDDSENSVSNDDLIILVKGAIGSYKNRLVQYLYLKKICEDKYPVFYIDFSRYEHYKFEDVDKVVEEDINEILAAYEDMNTNQSPLFIISNLRNYDVGLDNKVIYKYKRLLFVRKNLTEEEKTYKFFNAPSVKCIVSMDHAFIDTRQYENPFFEYSFDVTKRIRTPQVDYSFKLLPINLMDEDNAKLFIERCLLFFSLLDEKMDKEKLMNYVNNTWETFIHIGLETIDPFVIKYVWPILYPREITSNGSTQLPDKEECDSLSSIFKSVVSSLNVSNDNIDQLFTYEIGTKYISSPRQNYDFNKTVSKTNRTIIDYQIALHFVTVLKKLLIEYLRWPEVSLLLDLIKSISIIFTRSINRFILSMLTVDDYKHIGTFLYDNAEFLLENWVGNFLCELIYLYSFSPDYKDGDYSKTEVLNKVMEVVEKRSVNLTSGVRHGELGSNASVVYNKFVKRSAAIALARINEPKLLFKHIVNTFILPYIKNNQKIDNSNDDINLDCGFNLNYYGDLDEICCKEKANIPEMRDNLLFGKNTFTHLYYGCRDAFLINKKNFHILPKQPGEAAILIYKIMVLVHLFKRRENNNELITYSKQFCNELILKLYEALLDGNVDETIKGFLYEEILDNNKNTTTIINEIKKELESVFSTIDGEDIRNHIGKKLRNNE